MTFDRVEIAEVDRSGAAVSLAYVEGIEVPARPPGFKFGLPDSFPEGMVARGQGFVADSEDLTGEEKRIAGLAPGFGILFRSLIAVPLVSSSKVIGTLTFWCLRSDAYTHKELAMAEQVADQIAGVIANDKINTERLLTEKALRRSEEQAKILAHENALIAKIGRVISSSSNIDDVYDLFAVEVFALIPFDRIVIAAVDRETDTFQSTFVRGLEVPGRRSGESAPLLGSITDEVLNSLTAMLYQTEQEEEVSDRFPALLPEFKAGLRSFLTVPLVSSNEVVGILLIRSLTPNAYGDHEVSLAEQIGDQIAGAIANAGLNAKLEHEARERRILAEVGRIMGLSLDPDEVYELFAERVRELIPFDRLIITTVDLEESVATVSYVTGTPVASRKPGDVIPLEGTLTGEVVSKGSSVLVQGVTRDHIEVHLPRLLPDYDSGARSIVGLPLYHRGDVVGVLKICSSEDNAYTKGHMAIAESIAAQIAGAIANARLYAEQRRAELARAELEQEYRQAQKLEAIGQLVGGVVHDFNNLLTPIIAFSGLGLAIVDPKDRLYEYLTEIRKAGESAAHLTQQLLAFSRRQVIETEIVDLNELVINLDRMLRRLIGENIELVILPGQDLGLIDADPVQIEQVLVNLVVNANDALPDGGRIMIKTENIVPEEKYARLLASENSGECVLLTISDDGIGMCDEVKRRAFEPFFTTKESGAGTGLGLSTCYGIVAQLGGHITVESEPGLGTTFKVYIPITPKTSNLADFPYRKDLMQGGEETVLLVEDEASVRMATSEVLRSLGYMVVVASNGQDAIRVATESSVQKIDLLISDVVMPLMGGRELATWMIGSYPAIKVLFVSGYVDDQFVDESISDLEIGFLPKPFTGDTLSKKVRQVLDQR